VITGTATEVGKTWVASNLAHGLVGAGYRVVARKPVQSFEPGEPTDASRLAAMTGEPEDAVCPRQWSYPLPYAPPMAAQALGRTAPSLSEVIDWIASWPRGIDVGLVETVGGIRSPLCADGDSAALTERLAPDLIVLVANAELGSINAVRLSSAALPSGRVVVYLNHFSESDELHRANRSWLEHDGLELVADLRSLTGVVEGLAPSAD
jgi:dethiobiotin synthetase